MTRAQQFRRDDVRFDSGGQTCAAWLYLPAGDRPHPVVVMAHGFGGVRGMRLDAFAERFAGAGLAVLVFDYRHFGDSDGQPRHLIDINSQHQDYRAAARYARGRDELDPERVALWGSSFAGGHVLQVAAQDRRIAAVVSVGPHVDGLATMGAIPPRQAARVLRRGLADQLAAWRGRPRVTVPVVGRPGDVAALTQPGAFEGHQQMLPADGRYPDRVLAAITLRVAGYRPIRQAKQIAPPLLVQATDGDTVTPASAARKAAARAPRGEFRLYPGTDFQVYVPPLFEQVVSDQVAFLTRHLRSPGGAPPVAVVTGAGSGLGRALAVDLARRGHAVVCADLDLDRAQDTAGLLTRTSGLPALALPVDVRDEHTVEALAQQTEQALGPIDVWVNNAGVGIAGDVGQITPRDWRFVTDVDLLGVAWGCQVVVARMRERDRGRILNVASLAAYGTPAGQAPYNVAKAGVLALTESLRTELYGTNVTASALCPTYFVTGIADSMPAVDERARLRAQLLLADAAQGTPQSVAQAALDGLLTGQAYIFPQPFAKIVSRLKRLAPTQMTAISVLATRRADKLMAKHQHADSSTVAVTTPDGGAPAPDHPAPSHTVLVSATAHAQQATT